MRQPSKPLGLERALFSIKPVEERASNLTKDLRRLCAHLETNFPRCLKLLNNPRDITTGSRVATKINGFKE
jgi:hypothetical protein